RAKARHWGRGFLGGPCGRELFAVGVDELKGAFRIPLLHPGDGSLADAAVGVVDPQHGRSITRTLPRTACYKVTMVPEKYSLAAVGRFLLEQFELRRPGIREWTPEVEASLRQ